MSRLSNLLNLSSPAPTPRSSSPLPTTLTPTSDKSHHRRNASITTPLEALAIAATESSPVTSHTTRAPYIPNLVQESHSSGSRIDANGTTYLRQFSPYQAEAEKEARSKFAEKGAMSASEETSAFAAQNLAESPPSDQPVKNEEGNGNVVNKPSIVTSFAEVKKEPADSNPPTPAVQSPTVLPTTEGKKRAPPRITKKGTASVIKKPNARKRKIEATQSKDGTPFSQRSGTPNSTRGSKTPAPKNRKRGSITPAQSSPPRSVDGDDDDEADDDGEVFCICRKPDDHKWMIGCDGGCDDWFHGKCVNMKEEDEQLIDKYICPNCTDKGVGVTTWKPMCRLGGCREPARVAGPRPSKYCCDEHGVEFMQRKVIGNDYATTKGTNFKRKKTVEEAEASGLQKVGTIAQSNQAYLRGGILTPSEVKSLVSDSNGVDEFKSLGESVSVRNGNSRSKEDTAMEVEQDGELLSTPEERSRLEEINVKRAYFKHRQEALRDKEKFLGMVRSRASDVLNALNKKPVEGKKKDAIKDICGFDPRLSLSEPEFDDWRQSNEGSKALDSGVLGPPVVANSQVDGEGDTAMTNAAGVDIGEVGRGVCQKKRCDRHKAWYKLHQQEIASEKTECHQQLRKLEHESREIAERATIKKLEAEARTETAEP